MWSLHESSGDSIAEVKVGQGAVIMSLAVRGLIVMAGVALLMVVEVGAPPRPDEIYHRCQDEDNPASDYQSLAEKVAQDLIRNTPEQNYNFYGQETEQLLTSFGHGICRNNITFEDCIRCLQAASNLRIMLCHFVMDAIVSLLDCYMRISDRDFRWDASETIF